MKLKAPTSPVATSQPDARVPTTIRALLALGLWIGLAYGFAEGLEVSLLRLIPGALSWRNGNSAYVLWVAPLFYAAVFTFLALVAAGLSRIARTLPWDAVLVFITLTLGAFLGLTLPGKPFSDFAAAFLALGLGTELTRQYARRREFFSALIRKSLPFLVGAVAVVAISTIAFGWARESIAMRKVAAAGATAPNILLLIIDTQRADHLSAYGYQRETSPALARFAQEGMLFDNAYATSSWTLPSHASLMTGRPLNEHRAGLMRRPYLDKRFPTVAEALADHGYATGAFVANTFWTGRQTGLARGFLRYEDFYGNPGDAVARTALGRRLAYDVLPRFGFIDVPGRKYADEINHDLMAWVDRLGGRPFFAFVNYFDVHGPYLPPAPYAGKFSGATEDRHDKKIDIGALTDDVVVPPPAELQRMVDQYDESILFLDAQMNRLFEDLRKRNLLDNTMVMVTSDHGESWGEHGMMYHGHSLYRETLHVPMIIRFPKRAAPGMRDARPVSIQQFPATVADVAGLPAGRFPGTSIFAPEPPATDAVIAEVGRRSTVAANWPSSTGWLASLLTQRWQYTLHENGTAELFDLARDPRALDNVISEPAAADSAAALARTLQRLSPTGALDWRK